MGYTNSSLVTYKKLCGDYDTRNHKIDTITIHCFVGQVTAKRGCDYFFETDRDVSSNYVVGYDGSIGLSVEEKNRAWTSSSYYNDHRAVTIEVASETKSPYKVTDKAYNALIELVVDICERNGIKKLMWSNSKNERVNHSNGCNMTVHRDFASTACPGEFLYSHMATIAESVNKKLGSSKAPASKPTNSVSVDAPNTIGGNDMTRGYFKKGDRNEGVYAYKQLLITGYGQAAWTDEEALITESDDSFGQVSLGAHKLATLVKVSDELLYDSAFDLESFIATQFARRISEKEEDAFISGNGASKPTGILDDTGGAQVGVTAKATADVTADELIDLYYSLKKPYRKKATFLMNDATVKCIRKLKDSTGNYLWQPSISGGTPDKILDCNLVTSVSMPTLSASAKGIAFGDFSYYWIADRQNRIFKKLSELYAANGQVGFIGTQRVDGKLILPEAVKLLKMKASA